MHPFDDRDVLRDVIADAGKDGMIALTPARGGRAGRRRAHRSPDAVVTGAVTLDSRAVSAGDLFVAVAGERVDGHDFLGAAAAAGAVAALSARGGTTRCPASSSLIPWPPWAGWPPGCTPG